MKDLFKIFVTVLFYSQTFAQEIYSEMPFLIDEGVVKCRRINVAFNAPVILTPANIDTINTEIFKIKDNYLLNLLNQLSAKYGKPKIIKRFPDSVWGDTLITNKRTGKISSRNDISQCFSIDFPIPIPSDSVILTFKEIISIRYAEQPITLTTLITPNDPYFNSQWNLTKINAPAAWDITKGSSNIKVAVIDVGYANFPFDISNHEDFQLPGGGNKFVGGSLNNSSDHARESRALSELLLIIIFLQGLRALDGIHPFLLIILLVELHKLIYPGSFEAQCKMMQI